jgi:glutathione peroxidase
MKRTVPTFFIALAAAAIAGGAPMSDSLYGLKATTLQGKPADLAQYAGKVTLVVNVASACGYTPQYKGLQALRTELAGKGFEVLGFPSNEFGSQEPGSAEEIQTFCERNYGVTFPMFSKIVTKPGADQSPVYAFLTKDKPAPNWNFCKYLIGKDGKVIAFFPSKVTPESTELRTAIEAALK